MNHWTTIAMLERETTVIIQQLTERAIGSAQSLALKDAIAADLPKSIKLYLQCEVMLWLQKDLRNESHFSNIPSNVPVVQHLTKLYTRTLAPEYIFTREAFMITLENAVHFVENYLCRPQWTLVQFVFEKSERATLAEVQTRCEYLSDYLYYSSLVQSFMRQKGMQEIGRGDFRTLLARIDDQVVQRHNPKELALLTRPVFEYLLLQSEIAGKAIPLKPLVVFFDDKKMSAVKDYIESICRIRNLESLTIEQLAGIIEDLYSGAGPKTAPAKEPPSQSDIRHDVSRGRPERSGVPEAAAETKTVEIQQELDPVAPQMVETPTPRSEEPMQSVTSLSTDRRNIALSLTFSGMTSKAVASTSPLPDLRDAIDSDQRERFITTIFQKDKAYYDVVIETLNSMTTWKDASLYLQTFYQTSGVDPFVQDVVEFTDLIQHRYSL